MRIQLLLAACLLGPILANPILEDTCKSEMKRRCDCIMKYDHDIPVWWDDSFLEKIYPLQVWKDCVGDAKCEFVKELNELSEVMYNEFVYLNKNLRTCLGNGTAKNFAKTCFKPGTSKLPCEDRAYYDCMETEMKNHEFCNAQDVKAFEALVPLMIEDCILNKKVHDGKKIDCLRDGYKKTETSKSVFLSSFLDIVRTIFERN